MDGTGIDPTNRCLKCGDPLPLSADACWCQRWFRPVEWAQRCWGWLHG